MQPMASGSKPVRRALAAGSLGCSRADKVPGQCAQQQHVDYQMPGSESQVLVRASQPCSNCMGPQSAGTELIAWVYRNSFTGLPERRRSGKMPGRNVTLDAGGLGGMLSGAGQSAPYRQLGSVVTVVARTGCVSMTSFSGARPGATAKEKANRPRPSPTRRTPCSTGAGSCWATGSLWAESRGRSRSWQLS